MTSKHTLGIALGFTAGYVDTVGFVALFGLFTAHVTGNFVLIGSELAHPSHGVLIKFLAFPAFIFAVALARIVAVKLEASGKSAARALTGMQLLFLLVFMVLGCLSTPVQSTDAILPLVAGIAGAAAMGVQNAASRLVWTELAPTTVMTGNVTQIVIDLVDILRGSAVAGTKARLWKFLWPVLAFGVGAVGGAFAYMYAGFFSLGLPVGILCLLLFVGGAE